MRKVYRQLVGTILSPVSGLEIRDRPYSQDLTPEIRDLKKDERGLVVGPHRSSSLITL